MAAGLVERGRGGIRCVATDVVDKAAGLRRKCLVTVLCIFGAQALVNRDRVYWWNGDTTDDIDPEGGGINEVRGIWNVNREGVTLDKNLSLVRYVRTRVGTCL